jgi:membrane fusion protein, multidrug efflux system
MKNLLRNSVIFLLVSAIAGAVVWGFVAGRAESSDSDDAPVQAPPRATQVDGQTVLNFSTQAQRTNGIVVSMLASTRRAAVRPAAATVLDLQPLLDIKSKYESAQTAIAQAGAAAAASQAESRRLADLNRDSGNVAQKSIEAAQATAGSDSAALQNARQALAILEDSTRLHWGPTLAAWIEKGSPEFTALLAQRAYLVQVTATAPGACSAPAEAILELPDGAHLAAHRIAALPQVDARLQAPAYLYETPAHAGLVPGINLPVSLPSGPAQSGVVIPQSAVVYAQGSPWVYLEIAPDKFTRRQISTANPVPGGWFVAGTFAANSRIVTGGAQTLLSEEFRSQIQSDED